MENERILFGVICIGIISIAFIVTIYQFVFYKKRKKQIELQNSLRLGIEQISYLNKKIKDNEEEINQLNCNLKDLNHVIGDIQKEYERVSISYQEIKKQYENANENIKIEKSIVSEYHEKYQLIKEKYHNAKLENQNLQVVIKRHEENNLLLRSEIQNIRVLMFKRTEVYSLIHKLGELRAKDLKTAKVLNNSQRESLKKVIIEIYDDYIKELKEKFPHFTDDDILLICLNATGMKSVDIALCFGFIDTKAVNQRIYRIRKAGYEM